MSDFKPTNTKHILQDIKGQIILTSSIMLCLVTGTGIMAHSDIETHAINGIHASIETLIKATPKLIFNATTTLQQYATEYSSQFMTTPTSTLKSATPQNTPTISHSTHIDFTITTPHLTKISTDIFYTSKAAKNLSNSLNTTAMLNGNTPNTNNSPFTSYANKHIQTIPTHQNIKVASLSEINAFLSLRHTKYTYVDNKYFLKNVQTKLPKYKKIFQKAAIKYDLDWRLIASIAYQESVWNPKAVSPTGVRGMMMLTKATAQEMNVRDRTHAAESIFGGTRYFKKLLKRIPANVKGPNRTLMALAAYNMGYGHLIAARKLTKEQNADNTQWSEVKKRIPLLQQHKYYSKSKYGYARGARQAIHYVSEIQKHLDMLLMITERSAIEQGKISKNGIIGFTMTRYSG